MPAVSPNGPRCLRPFRLGQAGIEQVFGKPEDRGHGRADLVAHVGQKRALGLIGHLCRQAGGFQLLVDGFQLDLLRLQLLLLRFELHVGNAQRQAVGPQLLLGLLAL